MADILTLDLDAVLREGRAAALAGDMYAARTSFRHATELAPACADAWLGLSAAVPVLAEKRSHLQRALALAPDNEEARASLAYVEQLIREGHLLAPSRARHEAPRAELVAADAAAEPPPAAVAARCYRHPERETGLHCVQCGQPICGSCARLAAVGQLCPPCRSARRPVNYQVGARHLLVAGLVTLAVTGAAGALLSNLGFGGLYFGLLLGVLVGEGCVRLIERLTHGKRGPRMQIAAGACIIAGTLMGVCGSVAGAILLTVGLEHLPALLADVGLQLLIGPALTPYVWIYAVAAAATAAARLR